MPRPQRACARRNPTPDDEVDEEENRPPTPTPPPPKKAKKNTKAKKTKDEPSDIDLNQNKVAIDPPPVQRNILLRLSRPWPTQCNRHVTERDLARPAVVDDAAAFSVWASNAQLASRVTALAWSPTAPGLAAVGSKHGDVLLWKGDAGSIPDRVVEGIGPGGSIQCMKFSSSGRRLYTCSIDGTFKATEVSRGETVSDPPFLSTGDWQQWYTAFDVALAGDTMMAGDNKGFVTLLDGRAPPGPGQRVWCQRLHPKKVTNLQYSPREPWLFISTSTDHSVRVWDVRNMGGADGSKKKPEPLQSLDHVRAVNSAYFSRVDGTRLLTTDQHSELRVYSAPNWTLDRVIPHPHRQFQHLTPIKATWHPLADVIVAGRYPDPAFPGSVPGELRSVDLIDPDSGTVLHPMVQPGMNKIMSLNVFSPDGREMLSGAGQGILRWRRKEVNEEEEDEDGKVVAVSNLKASLEMPKAREKKRPKKTSNGTG